MNTAVFSVIFNANLPYLKNFLQSLVDQTERTFDLLLLVDDVPDIETHLMSFRDQLSIKTKMTSGTISNIRQTGINWVAAQSYDKIIFADTDDLLNEDRVHVASTFLEQHPIVIHDLVPFKTDFSLASPGFWSRRIEHGQTITHQDILQSNIAGLGNTSVRTALLRSPIYWFANKAIDWCFFFQLLRVSNGVFVHSGKTLYRQHQLNTAGVQNLTPQRLIDILAVKVEHFKSLHFLNTEMEKLLRKNEELKKKLEYDSVKLLHATQTLNNGMHYFWWEETNYIS